MKPTRQLIASSLGKKYLMALTGLVLVLFVLLHMLGNLQIFIGPDSLNALPQGKPEKDRRALNMVAAMDEAGFGNCTNYGECAAVCPKEITLDAIAQLNRDYGFATIKNFFGKVD